MCSGCPKLATFGPAGGRAHRCKDCRIEGDVDVLSSICSTCLAFTASYGSTSEGPRRCFGCKLPGDVPKYKRLCRTCYKHRPEYGSTPRKKPKTCSSCRTRGQLHRDSDWLWNMLVTRKPRKGKKHKILWSEETLRDQLWWLKPQKKVKREVKTEGQMEDVAFKIKVEPGIAPGATGSSGSAPANSSSPAASATRYPRLEVRVKTEPGTGRGGAGNQ
jgi:hypothetical protein